MMSTNQYEREIVRHIRRDFPRFDANQVFSDMVKWLAYSIRQPISFHRDDDIQKQLQALGQKYSEQETKVMAEMFALFQFLTKRPDLAANDDAGGDGVRAATNANFYRGLGDAI